LNQLRAENQVLKEALSESEQKIRNELLRVKTEAKNVGLETKDAGG